MRSKKQVLLLLTYLFCQSAAHGEDSIFDFPKGKAIGSFKAKGRCWNFKESERDLCGHDEGMHNRGETSTRLLRVTIDAFAGAAKGRDTGTLGYVGLSAEATARKSVEALNYMDALAHGSARAGIALGDGVPLYQLKLSGAGSIFPGGLMLAVESSKFSRFSETFAAIGYTNAVQIRLNGLDYILMRINIGVKNGSVNFNSANSPELAAANSYFSRRPDGSASFPYGANIGPTTLRVLEAQFLMKLSKFAVNVEVSHGIDNDTNTGSGVPDGTLQAEKMTRFDTYASVVFPLKLVFPNDALKFEGRYVSYSMTGDLKTGASGQLQILRDQQITTDDGYFGVSYGLTW